jgi:inner membrane protein
MATVGHVAVGLAAARACNDGRQPRWPVAAAWSALAVLPDADIIGFPLGIHYQAAWGHRGATHSLAFALAAGLVVGLAARWFKRPFARTAAFASLTIGSHGLLDTFSDGGLGCALLWPFDLTRYFAPWRPIPVAPIGFGMLSVYGLIVVVAECVLFAPLLFVALRPVTLRRKPAAIGALVGLWLVAAWLFASTDPVRDRVVAFVLRDKTVFTEAFSEDAFRTIASGTSDEEIRRRLGTPYGQGWFYESEVQADERADETASASLHECRSIRFEKGVVLRAMEVDACRALGIQPGTLIDDVSRRLGSPSESCWVYSWSAGWVFRMRMVCFNRAKVDAVVAGWALSE